MTQQKDKNNTGMKFRILLVEKNAENASLITQALTDGGMEHETVVVGDSKAALIELKENPSDFDILLTDHMIPGITGLELCIEIIETGLQLPTVLLASSGSENLATIALKSGVNDYIIKDAQKGYLELLPVVLPAVIRKYQDRLARCRAEESLRISEEKYRLLIENSSMSIVAFDTEGKFTLLNSNAAALLGGTPDDFKGKSLDELFSAESLGKYVGVLQEILKNGQEFSAEELVNLPAGPRWIRSTLNPLLDDNGTISGVQLIAQDISIQKRTELALQQSECRFRELADMLPQMIFELDLKGRFTYYNRRFEQFTGYTQLDLIKGLNILDMVNPEDKDEIQKVLLSIFSGKSIEGEELIANTKAGDSFQVLVYASPIRHKKSVTGLRGAAVDISNVLPVR